MANLQDWVLNRRTSSAFNACVRRSLCVCRPLVMSLAIIVDPDNGRPTNLFWHLTSVNFSEEASSKG